MTKLPPNRRSDQQAIAEFDIDLVWIRQDARAWSQKTGVGFRTALDLCAVALKYADWDDAKAKAEARKSKPRPD